MTEFATAPGAAPPEQRPGHDTRPRFKLYTDEFAADPDKVYRKMRAEHRSLAPVELAPGVHATLVISHKAAVRILHDPHDRFSPDPRTWQKTIPADCPVLPMLGYSPAARHHSGSMHERYRLPSVEALNTVDGLALYHYVETLAVPLINTFCQTGSADIVSQYARPLVFAVINWMLGCPAEIGQRIMEGTAARFDTVHAAEGMHTLKIALRELIAIKRRTPGEDVTSRMAVHPHGLDDEELLAQLMSFYGAGIEPQTYLIVNTLLLMLVDERFRGSLLGGNLSTQDAVDEAAYTDPPMANFCPTYPRQPVLIDDVWLPANQPVLIGIAACNRDPEIRGGRPSIGNRAHLAWSTGPHACPATATTRITVESAIDNLLDALPDIELDVPADKLVYRPGPFHRAVEALPVRFPPSGPFPFLA